MPPAPQSSGSRFPMFCFLGVHWASWLIPGWSWGSMFCSLGGSWGSWFAPGWSLGSMFSIAYRYCTSSFHMFIAYLYRISLLRIFIAYVYCISLLHISVAYLYCISILHISVAVLLSFVAWWDYGTQESKKEERDDGRRVGGLSRTPRGPGGRRILYTALR